MTIKRYHPEIVGEYGLNSVNMDESPEGDWVRYEDAILAVAEEREVCAEIAGSQKRDGHVMPVASSISHLIRSRAGNEASPPSSPICSCGKQMVMKFGGKLSSRIYYECPGCLKRTAYSQAPKDDWVKNEDFETLRQASKNLLGLVKDIDLGRSIHNARHPEQPIEGPLWTQLMKAAYVVRDILDTRAD